MAKTTELLATVALPATGFVRVKQLLFFVPFGRTTIWRKVKAGDFPRPVKLSQQVTAWRVEDVRQWIERMGGNPV